MMTKKKNKKGLYFLIVLCTFSFFAIKITKKISSETKPNNIEAEAAQECIGCGNAQQLNSENTNNTIDTDTSTYSISYLDESETIDITDQLGDSSNVLGLSDVISALGKGVSCSDFDIANILGLSSTVCNGGSGDINYRKGQAKSEGVLVSKDAKIELVAVTYPLAYWLGPYTYKDSTKEIDNSGEYRSNGEVIDETYQTKTLAPAEAVTFRDDVSVTERKDFIVQGTVTASPEEEQGSMVGEYVMKNADNDPVTQCSPEVAVSDYNVGRSNYIASHSKYGAYSRQQIPGGDKYDDSPQKYCLNEENEPDESKAGNILSCFNVKAYIKGLFESIFGGKQWTRCTVGEVVCELDENGVEDKENCKTVKENTCLDAENLQVEMTSIFGDPYECTTELCANAFMTYMYKGTLTPEEADSKVISTGNLDNSLMKFIGTPCMAQIIDGDLDMTVPVTCLWDDSQTLSNYRMQKIDQAPGEKGFPATFADYWSKAEVNIEKSAEYYQL